MTGSEVTDALRLLVDFGWLREVRIDTAGRPAIEYHKTNW